MEKLLKVVEHPHIYITKNMLKLAGIISITLNCLYAMHLYGSNPVLILLSADILIRLLGLLCGSIGAIVGAEVVGNRQPLKVRIVPASPEAWDAEVEVKPQDLRYVTERVLEEEKEEEGERDAG